MPRRTPLDEDVKRAAQELAEKRRAERDRGWDQEHRAFTLRIRAHDADRLATQAQALRVSRDALAAALLWAALDALEAGNLGVEAETVTTEKTDRLGRFRTYTRRILRPFWKKNSSESF